MRRKILPALALALALLLPPAGGAAAADTGATVVVNGRTLTGRAFFRDGVTYVHIVPLLEALGGWETVWEPETRQARAETGLCTLCARAGDSYILLDGCAYDLPSPVIGLEGRTYVPLRAVAEVLGAEVTFVASDEPIAVESRAPSPWTQEDLYWLSRVISAESRGECLKGQIAVGNVVLNRVASPDYPDDVRGVVFDTRDAVQFTPTANGTIFDEPTDQSVLAARLALANADAVGGCMFFFCPALSPGTWIRENCRYYTTIGCHRFYL